MTFLPVCAGAGGTAKPGGGGPGGAADGPLIPWKSVAVYGGGGSIFLLFAICMLYECFSSTIIKLYMTHQS